MLVMTEDLLLLPLSRFPSVSGLALEWTSETVEEAEGRGGAGGDATREAEGVFKKAHGTESKEAIQTATSDAWRCLRYTLQGQGTRNIRRLKMSCGHVKRCVDIRTSSLPNPTRTERYLLLHLSLRHSSLLLVLAETGRDVDKHDHTLKGTKRKREGESSLGHDEKKGGQFCRERVSTKRKKKKKKTLPQSGEKRGTSSSTLTSCWRE